MKLYNRALLACLVIFLTMPGFSQETKPKKEGQPVTDRSKDETKEEPKSDDLRKIATGSGYRDLDFDINIDEEALEANIEMAVENAMESVEAVLESLEIHIEPIEIDMRDVN